MESTNEESHDISPFELLPTQILQKILGYLPVNERVRAERVCKRWKNECTGRVWSDVQVLHFTPPMADIVSMRGNELCIDANEYDIIESLVSRAGQYVKKLLLIFNTNNSFTAPVLSTIIPYCHNVESINTFCEEECTAEALSEFIEVNKQLHSVSCYDGNNAIGVMPLRDWKSLKFGIERPQKEGWREQLVALIQNSPSLEEFSLYHSTPEIVAALVECQQLKTLYCGKGFSKITDDLMMGTSLLNRLTYLQIKGEQDDVDAIIKILPHCINLETLRLILSHGDLLERIPEAVLALPKLEALELEAKAVTDQILMRLLKFKRLWIMNRSKFITENGIFEMIMSSGCFEKLKIPSLLTTTDLFERLVRNTKERCEILEIGLYNPIYQEALKICEGSNIRVINEGLY